MTTAPLPIAASSELRDRDVLVAEHASSAETIRSIFGESPSLPLHHVEASAPYDLLKVLLDNAPVGVCLFDARLNLILCNSRMKRLLEYPDELFQDSTLTMEDLFRFNAERGEYGPGDVETLVHRRLDKARQGLAHVYERTRPNGIVVEIRGVPLASGGFLSIYSDVTEQRQRLYQLDAIIENFPGGICLFDKNMEMVLHNRELLQLLELPPSLFQNGKPSLEQLFRFNAARGEYGPGQSEELVQQRLERLKERCSHVYRRRRPNGTTVEVRGVPIKGSGFLSTYVDVTDQSRRQELVAHMAHHDGLTDLPNRLLLMDRLQTAVAQAKRGNPIAVHYLDLDNFKPVNDTYGHDVGDELLKSVANRLRKVLRETDTLTRIGGDEFVVSQVGIHDPGNAETLANRVIETLCAPFDCGGHTIKIGISIGISLAPEHGTNPTELLKLADQALYRAKSKGRRTFEISKSQETINSITPIG